MPWASLPSTVDMIDLYERVAKENPSTLPDNPEISRKCGQIEPETELVETTISLNEVAAPARRRRVAAC